jgi:hypothetical protein
MLDLKIDIIYLTVQLNLLKSVVKNHCLHEMRHACNNITMQYGLLQSNYYVIINTLTSTIQDFNLNIPCKNYDIQLRYLPEICKWLQYIVLMLA